MNPFLVQMYVNLYVVMALYTYACIFVLVVLGSDLFKISCLNSTLCKKITLILT